MKSYIEHVAVCVKDILWSEKFFKDVLRMEETRRALNDDGTLKSLWFKNGIQLMAGGSKQAHHLGLIVDDYAKARADMLAYEGVKQMEGKPEKWIQLPDGTVIELFQANDGVIDDVLNIKFK